MNEPIALSQDIFRHEPIAIRLLSESLGAFSKREFTSRHVRRKGVIVEIVPQLVEPHPFISQMDVMATISLPYQRFPVSFPGVINKVITRAVDSKGDMLSVIGIHFRHVDVASAQLLETHDLMVQTTLGSDRSARVSATFPLEISGIDVMHSLVVKDVSMTGMFVAGGAKFPLGKELRVKFRLPFQQKDVSLNAKVVWQGEKELSVFNEKLTGFGLRFVKIPRDTNLALATYCSRSMVLA